MQLFSADACVFKKKIKNVLDPENMKKLPSNVAHIGPQLFLCTGPAAQMAQKQKYHNTQKPLNAGLGI